MLVSRIYYRLKPMLPWRLRLALRRWRASRRRRVFAEVWPIDFKSSRVPLGWPGWPDGKRFAVILTHDVEGSKGLSRIEQLMNLERDYGFVSCYNLVPEGEYCVPVAIREMLKQA